MVGLGVATNYWPAKDAMLVFAVLVVIAITASVTAVLSFQRRSRPYFGDGQAVRGRAAAAGAEA